MSSLIKSYDVFSETFYQKTLPDEVYYQADSLMLSCRDSFVSRDVTVQRKSVFFTNCIVHVLEHVVREPLRKIPVFPYVGAHVDRETSSKIRKVYEEYCLFSHTTSDGDSQNKERDDLWRRTCNLLCSLYRPEMLYLFEFLCKVEQLDAVDAMGTICMRNLGSLADGVAARVEQLIYQREFFHTGIYISGEKPPTQ